MSRLSSATRNGPNVPGGLSHVGWLSSVMVFSWPESGVERGIRDAGRAREGFDSERPEREVVRRVVTGAPQPC